MIRASEQELTRREAELAAAREEHKRARMLADQKELQLKTGEEKIRGLKVRLNQCSTNKEYQALKEQIAADEMANSVLADEILEALEKVDEARAKVAESEARFGQGKAALQKVKDQVQADQEHVQRDIDRLEADLRAAEDRLPADVKQEYLRIVRLKGSDAMAAVEDNCCSGCFQNLTPNTVNLLSLGQVVFCKSCGRLLYLPE